MPLLPQVLSALAFIPAVVFAWSTLTLYKYRDPVDTEALTQRHLLKGYKLLLAEIAKAHRDAIDRNDVVHRDRVKKWNLALVSLGVAVTIGVLGIAIEGLTMGDDKQSNDAGQQPKEPQQSLADLINNAEGMGTTVQRGRSGPDGSDGTEVRHK